MHVFLKDQVNWVEYRQTLSVESINLRENINILDPSLDGGDTRLTQMIGMENQIKAVRDVYPEDYQMFVTSFPKIPFDLLSGCVENSGSLSVDEQDSYYDWLSVMSTPVCQRINHMVSGLIMDCRGLYRVGSEFFKAMTIANLVFRSVLLPRQEFGCVISTDFFSGSEIGKENFESILSAARDEWRCSFCILVGNHLEDYLKDES